MKGPFGFSVPAGLDCNVPISAAIGVMGTGFVEQIEIGVRQIEPIATESSGQLGTTPAMPIVHPFIDPPGVMEHGER
jgi:hypothetical protein